MEPRTVVCTCGKSFVITNPRSRQAFCSLGCRPGRKPTALPGRSCDVCSNTFIPVYDCQKYCNEACRKLGFRNNRQVERATIPCLTCSKEFTPRDATKKFCSVKCSSARHGTVTNQCTICDKSFTVAYRFRGTKTCSPECTKKSISRTLTTRETKQCLACGSDFAVVQSYKNRGKYCSKACCLSTRKTRQPDVTKTCERCKKEFVVKFTDSAQRFCGYSCANSGENNGMFGKPGPLTGRPAWSKGLTKETDPRLRALGEKISIIVADKIVSGTWSPPTTGFKGEHYVGQKNGGAEAYLRSSYESTYARMLDADSNVVAWDHEPLRIPYVYEGSIRNYVPDFLVTHVDGRKTLVEVKPDSLAGTAPNLAKLNAAASWCELNGIELTIVTEKEL